MREFAPMHCTHRLVVVLVHGDAEEVVEVLLELLLPRVHLVGLQHRVGPLGEAGQGGTAAAPIRGQLSLLLLAFGLKFETLGQMLQYQAGTLKARLGMNQFLFTFCVPFS